MLHIGRKDRLATNCSVTAQNLAHIGSRHHNAGTPQSKHGLDTVSSFRGDANR